MAEEYVLYIFVNQDLDMSKGLIAAQVAHITQIIVEDLIRKSYECSPPPKEVIDYMRWKMKPTVVIMRAPDAQLRELLQLPNSKYFVDSGERIPNNSLTVVGFYPNAIMHDKFKDYKLL